MKSFLLKALAVALLATPSGTLAVQKEVNQAVCGDAIGSPNARFTFSTLSDTEISRIGAFEACGDGNSIEHLVVEIKRINEQSVQLARNAIRAHLDGRISHIQFNLDSIDEDWISSIEMADLFWDFGVSVSVDERSDCAGACSLVYVAATQRKPLGRVALSYPSPPDSVLEYKGQTVSSHVERIYRRSYAEKAFRFSQKNAEFDLYLGPLDLQELDLIANEGETGRWQQRVKEGCGDAYFERYERAEALKRKTCDRVDIDDYLQCLNEFDRASGTGWSETSQCITPFEFPDIN